VFNGAVFDLLLHFQDVLAPSEADICGRRVVHAFVIASGIIVVQEGEDEPESLSCAIGSICPLSAVGDQFFYVGT
jgi:hypothetical protein